MMRQYLSKKDLCHDALRFYCRMLKSGSGTPPYKSIYPRILRACAGAKAVDTGRQVHGRVIRNGCASDAFVATGLIDFYGKCGNVEDARHVFDQMSCEPCTVTYNAMLAAYAKAARFDDAFGLFRIMQLQELSVNATTVVNLIQACHCPEQDLVGIIISAIHGFVIRMGFESNVFVGTCLVCCYSRCMDIDSSFKVFDGMACRNRISWNAAISACAHNGFSFQALQLFRQMQMDEDEILPDSVCLQSLLKACSWCCDVSRGSSVHAYALRRGFQSCVHLTNSLVTMYAKCGNLAASRIVFERISPKDVVSWNCMISGYCDNGEPCEALMLFNGMLLSGATFNAVTMVSVLQACSQLGFGKAGMSMHGYAIKMQLDSNPFVGNSLLSMYFICGEMDIAQRVFEMMPKKTVVSWNSMISGYMFSRQAMKSLEAFRQMLSENAKPDSITLSAILPAYAYFDWLPAGMAIHSYIVKTHSLDAFVGTALMDMYAKYGNLTAAETIFNSLSKKDVATWNSMLSAYCQSERASDTLSLFEQMQRSSVIPDALTVTSLVQACANLGALDQGKRFHAYAVRTALCFDDFMGNSLIAMYAKCGSIVDAEKIFSENSKKDVTSWNAMITGYVQNGIANKALHLFQQMQYDGVIPDFVTVVNILPVCANSASLQHAKCIHGLIIKKGFEGDVFVGSGLIDMYAKCGSLDFARRFFDSMPQKTVGSWNSLIQGYGLHGYGKDVLALFSEMQNDGLKPDKVTMISLLFACSHAGLVDEARRCFTDMFENFGIEPQLEHYSCMIDLLGRAGKVDDAHSLIKKLPFKADAGLLGSWPATRGISCSSMLSKNGTSSLST